MEQGGKCCCMRKCTTFSCHSTTDPLRLPCYDEPMGWEGLSVLPVCTCAICSFASYVYFPQAPWLQGVFFFAFATILPTPLFRLFCVYVCPCACVSVRAYMCVCVYPTWVLSVFLSLFFFILLYSYTFLFLFACACPSAIPSINKKMNRQFCMFDMCRVEYLKIM